MEIQGAAEDYWGSNFWQTNDTSDNTQNTHVIHKDELTPKQSSTHSTKEGDTITDKD